MFGSASSLVFPFLLICSADVQIVVLKGIANIFFSSGARPVWTLEECLSLRLFNSATAKHEAKHFMTVHGRGQ